MYKSNKNNLSVFDSPVATKICYFITQSLGFWFVRVAQWRYKPLSHDRLIQVMIFSFSESPLLLLIFVLSVNKT